MNPDDVVLVALVNNPRDLELVERERWYRIPVRHAPKYFDGAQYLALYLARAFGDRKWAIDEYAPVRGHELVRRRDLIPDETNHPRADELYYKLELGPVQRREPPILSKRGRRVLFLWTTWSKFSTARELNDLFAGGSAQDKLWEAFKSADMDVERQMTVREGHSRYRVDFLIYCPQGRIGLSIGDKQNKQPTIDQIHPVHPVSLVPDGHLRLIKISETDLENHFERVLGRIKRQAHEMGQH